jgi:CHASE2 domain-containing sensor protein
MGYHWFIIFVYLKTFPKKKTADQRPPYVPFGVACLTLILVPSICAIATAWEARPLESLGLLTVILKLAMLYVSLCLFSFARCFTDVHPTGVIHPSKTRQ